MLLVNRPPSNTLPDQYFHTFRASRSGDWPYFPIQTSRLLLLSCAPCVSRCLLWEQATVVQYINLRMNHRENWKLHKHQHLWSLTRFSLWHDLFKQYGGCCGMLNRYLVSIRPVVNKGHLSAVSNFIICIAYISGSRRLQKDYSLMFNVTYFQHFFNEAVLLKQHPGCSTGHFLLKNGWTSHLQCLRHKTNV